MTAPTKFRKKPIVIEAVQWTGANVNEVLPFFGDFSKLPNNGAYVNPGIGHCPPEGTLTIPTLEGDMTASAGDWIIKGVNGEFYPCKPDIFEKTYELAKSSPQTEQAEREMFEREHVTPGSVEWDQERRMYIGKPNPNPSIQNLWIRCGVNYNERWIGWRTKGQSRAALAQSREG